jgi:2-hydroxycyclohexanecarboxyl-CoA dehydrogenase
MQLNLSGQKIAVFGAANGIGRAIAEAFINENCQVIGFDADKNASPLPGENPIIPGDVTNCDQLTAFAQQHPDTNHVVFSVGVGSGKFGFPFWKNLTPANWPRVLEINLVGAVNVAHAFAPTLIEKTHGSMLFLTSVAGQIGSQTDPPYSAAKAGLINFMQVAAKDFAPHGIRANALSPGMVQTDLNESVYAAGQENLPPDQRQDYETWAHEKIKTIAPLGQWQEPHEFAAMALFLASPHAKSITGQTINIDGGQVMHA